MFKKYYANKIPPYPHITPLSYHVSRNYCKMMSKICLKTMKRIHDCARIVSY